MSGGGTPKDNSVQLEQMKEASAAAAQTAADQKAATDAANLASLRSAAQGSAKSNAENYFWQQGVDPTTYNSNIDSIINSIAGGISQSDPNPGSYYTDVGQQAYDQATTAAQTSAERSLDPIFGANFEYTRIPTSYTDPTEAAILAEQRATADSYLNNLLARGVITDPGYAAGAKNLDTQSSGVAARLDELAQGVEETGRQSLRDVSGRAMSAADTLKLGQTFDPSTYSKQLDDAFSSFVNSLGSTIRGKVGTANLFDTSGLSAIAGAAQGAGASQVYDPNAVAGLVEDDTNKNATTNRTGTSTGVL